MIKEKLWKTMDFCNNGCWCRSIVTVDFINEKQTPDDCLIGSGHLSKDEAEYFVELHNAHLRSIKLENLI